MGKKIILSIIIFLSIQPGKAEFRKVGDVSVCSPCKIVISQGEQYSIAHYLISYCWVEKDTTYVWGLYLPLILGDELLRCPLLPSPYMIHNEFMQNSSVYTGYIRYADIYIVDNENVVYKTPTF